MYIYTFLGITDDAFTIRIKPFLSHLMSKGGKVDQALLAIETSHLNQTERLYCAYEVGVLIGSHPEMHRSKLRKLMGLVMERKA